MNRTFLHIIFFLIAAAAFLCFSNNVYAQWGNDPSANTKLVIEPVDPINISALRDFNGGAYVFWEDKKGTSSPDIYYIHFNKKGDVSFRADGKVVSTRSGLKENPIVVVGPFGNSIIMWKGFDKRKNSELFIQKLSKNGLRLWQNEGIQLTDNRIDKVDFSLQVDKFGYVYSGYITKSLSPANKFSVRYNVQNSDGRLLSDPVKSILYNSNSTLSEIKIVPDNKGGLFFFWQENLNQKTVLRLQFIDSTGSKVWGNKPITISKPKNNVLNYSVGKLGSGVYTAFTYQGSNKIIYQNLISDKGQLLWGDEGKLLTYQPGSQSNPQFAFVDSCVVVSWTNEFDKIKDVFIQRFDVKGERLWGSNGKKITNIKGNQFGQRIVYDQKGGVIIAWIDKQPNKSDAKLYIQKINSKGKLVWDSTGVMISSSQGMEKSYLNLVPDGDGGAVAVFKGTIDKKNNIYGQKIFSTGTYASQILGFKTEIENDSVKISWYAANETDGTIYNIYRSTVENASDSDWSFAGSVEKNLKTNTNYYEFYDKPDINGSVYYRIEQMNDNAQTLYSEMKKVDYYHNADGIILGQNYPNPFSDSTIISFYLPDEEKVTIDFYNGNIETIKKIEDVVYPAGKNQIVFDAEGLPPGVYFYRLKVNKFIQVKKMIIIDDE